MGRLSYLKTLREPVYTRLCMVKDIDRNEYFVEKSLMVSIDFQKQLFQNEINVHSRLEHRYIVKFIEKIEEYRFLMEYASVGNLQTVIDAGLDTKTALKIALNFLKGLAYLHEEGLVHNDVKPSNILVGREYRAKLSDFAFCGKVGHTTFKDIPSYFVLGSELYKPPQQLDSYVNRYANDIYAVNRVLFLLFSCTGNVKQPDPALVPDLNIRRVVSRGLQGAYHSVESIIKDLSRLKNDEVTG